MGHLCHEQISAFIVPKDVLPECVKTKLQPQILMKIDFVFDLKWKHATTGEDIIAFAGTQNQSVNLLVYKVDNSPSSPFDTLNYRPWSLLRTIWKAELRMPPSIHF